MSEKPGDTLTPEVVEHEHDEGEESDEYDLEARLEAFVTFARLTCKAIQEEKDEETCSKLDAVSGI